MCRDAVAADDLVQEALIRALKGLPRFVPGTDLKAWCFRILRNAFFNERRRIRRGPVSVEDISVEPWVPSGQESGVAFRETARVLLALPVDQREAIALICFHGYTYEQAAQIADCAVGTVKARVSRARVRLRQAAERPKS